MSRVYTRQNDKHNLQYLFHTQPKEKQLVSMMDPVCVSFLMMLDLPTDMDELYEMQLTLNLNTSELILIPVNNAIQRDCFGTHWSLLIYRKTSQTFEHCKSTLSLLSLLLIMTLSLSYDARRVLSVQTIRVTEVKM